jgi:hypothetical protein
MTSFKQFFIRVADITLAVVGTDSALNIQCHSTIEKFLSYKSLPDVNIQVQWGDLSEKKLEGQRLFNSGSVWQLYQQTGSFLFSFTSPGFGPIPYKIANVNKNFSKSEVLINNKYFNKDHPIYPLEYPLDELLLINYLALGRGVEIHACGLVDSRGNGHLFVGQSTAGKTTMAKLWENESGITILSDDRIILRRMGNKIWMYGTPWHGEAILASPTRAPLTAVYFLGRGQKNELVAQKPSDSISRLFACSFPPFYNRDALDFTLAFLEDVVKKVPCSELKFTPDKSVVEFIKGERFT